jgi:hypothetical protein
MFDRSRRHPMVDEDDEAVTLQSFEQSRTEFRAPRSIATGEIREAQCGNRGAHDYRSGTPEIHRCSQP